MYTIKQKFITINKFSRPGIKQLKPRAIVLHWTANPGGTAENHYNYFNRGGGGRYAGAHYFVDSKEILQLVPDSEVCYHANEGGYSKVSYLNNLTVGSYRGNANVASIGIEMCVEKDGSYHPNTIKQSQWLAQELLKRHGLGQDRLITHHMITGKQCPKGYLTKAALDNFKKQDKGELNMSQYKELKALIEAQDKKIKAQEGNTSQEASKVLEKEWNWGVSKEITDGRNPHQPASRQHVMAFLNRYDKLSNLSPTAKKDLQELFDNLYAKGHFKVQHTVEGKSDSEVLGLLVSALNRLTRD